MAKKRRRIDPRDQRVMEDNIHRWLEQISFEEQLVERLTDGDLADLERDDYDDEDFLAEIGEIYPLLPQDECYRFMESARAIITLPQIIGYLEKSECLQLYQRGGHWLLAWGEEQRTPYSIDLPPLKLGSRKSKPTKLGQVMEQRLLHHYLAEMAGECLLLPDQGIGIDWEMEPADEESWRVYPVVPGLAKCNPWTEEDDLLPLVEALLEELQVFPVLFSSAEKPG